MITTTTTATAPTTTTKPTAKQTTKPKPKPKPLARLTATLASTAAFPERSLGLWTSLPKALTSAQLRVTENGQPVSGLTLTPLAQAGNKDFGVIVILDESSNLSPYARRQELTVAQEIANQRTGAQEFGLVSFGASAMLLLPPTSDPHLISAAVAVPPLAAPGSSLLPALSIAYSELQHAGLATGAVVVVTAGKPLASPAAEAATSQAGLKLGYLTATTDFVVPTARVKLTTNTAGGGHGGAVQDAVLGPQLQPGDVWHTLSAGYLVSYRSTAKPGDSVTVAVSADGVAGMPTMQYTATEPAPTPEPKMPPLSQLPLLAGQPSFAQFLRVGAPVAPAPTSRSFWSSPLSLVVVSSLCAALLAGALWLLVGGLGRTQLESRVASFIPDGDVAEGPSDLGLTTDAGAPPFLARRRWWPGFALKVDVARFRRSPVTLAKLALAGSLVAFVLLTLLYGAVVGFFIGLPLGPVVLWAVLRRAARRSRTRFTDRLPSSLQDMAGAVRGGRSLAGAISAITDGADQPILGEFERVIADEQLGRPLEDSLHTVAERMQSEDMEQVSLVAALHRRSGSGVAEALDHVAEGARERGELIRELKSLTGQARLSSRILTALPIVVFIIMSFLQPTYMRPLTHTTGGIIVLVFCAFMILLGWLSMKRIVNVEA